MAKPELVEKLVVLTISDPWDFGEECGVRPFYGRITDVDNNRLLIELDAPILYQSINYLAAFGQVRHVDSSVSDLLVPSKPLVPMNITLLHREVERFADLGNDAFVRNVAVIGDVRLHEASQ